VQPKTPCLCKTNQWLKCHVRVQTDQKVVRTSNSEHWGHVFLSSQILSRSFVGLLVYHSRSINSWDLQIFPLIVCATVHITSWLIQSSQPEAISLLGDLWIWRESYNLPDNPRFLYDVLLDPQNKLKNWKALVCLKRSSQINSLAQMEQFSWFPPWMEGYPKWALFRFHSRSFLIILVINPSIFLE